MSLYRASNWTRELLRVLRAFGEEDVCCGAMAGLAGLVPLAFNLDDETPAFLLVRASSGPWRFDRTDREGKVLQQTCRWHVAGHTETAGLGLVRPDPRK